MTELRATTFAPIKYIVPGIIVEGLTLLAGKPKMGKSWLVLHAALAVGRGGFTLGEIKCPQGDVLYCALEDNARRLRSRLDKLLPQTMTDDIPLTFITEMPRLAAGGKAVLEEWIASQKNPRLIIIDTLAMIAPIEKKREQTQFSADYMALLELRNLTQSKGIGIIVVCHLRKADADDALDTVSGTLGLTAMADTTLVLRKEGNSKILYGRGRDMGDIEKALTFDPSSCLWRVEGDATVVRMSDQRKVIMECLQEEKAPMAPREIADATGMKGNNIRRLLKKMRADGEVTKTGTCYTSSMA